MTEHDPPRLAALLVRLVTPAGERELVTSELIEIFRERAAVDRATARRWYRSQVARSVLPALRMRLRRPSRTTLGGGECGLLPSMRSLLAAVGRSMLLTRRHTAEHPLLAVAIVATLTLGLAGASSAATVIRGVLLRPLPYPEPSRIAWLRVDTPSAPDNPFVTGAELASLRGLDAIANAAAVTQEFRMRLADSAEPTSARVVGVTPDLFDVLGIAPEVGSVPHEPDPRSPTVLLAWSTWQHRFGADSSLVDRTVELGGRAVRVAGVVPRGFRLPLHDDVGLSGIVDGWMPVTSSADNVSLAGSRAIVRLHPDATFESASAQMQAAGAALAAQYPDEFGREPRTYRFVSAHEHLTARVRPAITIVGVAFGLMLLSASFNAATLLVARAAAHRSELAVRTALGARRGDLVVEAITESLGLAVVSTGLGLVLGHVLLRALLQLDPHRLPRADNIQLDSGVVALTVLLGASTTLVFGALPAVFTSRIQPWEALATGCRVIRGRAPRAALIAAQIAVSVALVVSAGLMVRTTVNLSRVPLGFDPASVAVAKVVAPMERSDGTFDFLPFYARLQAALNELSEVEAVGAISTTPFLESGAFYIEPFTVDSARGVEESGQADVRWILDGYFRTMQVRFVEGRAFTRQEVEEGSRVAIVSSRLAATHWPDESALGRRLRVRDDHAGSLTWMEVVGVVEETRLHGLRDEGRPQIYQPLRRSTFGLMSFVVRQRPGTELPLSSLGALAAELGARDVYQHRQLVSIVNDDMATTALVTAVVLALGVVAAVLAMIGIYGLAAHGAEQRRGETSVRVALGANRWHVVLFHLRAGLRAPLLGIVLGLPLALAVAAGLRAQLFGVPPHDPATLAIVTVTSIILAVLASYLPARRAARLDPAVELRA